MPAIHEPRCTSVSSVLGVDCCSIPPFSSLNDDALHICNLLTNVGALGAHQVANTSVRFLSFFSKHTFFFLFLSLTNDGATQEDHQKLRQTGSFKLLMFIKVHHITLCIHVYILWLLTYMIPLCMFSFTSLYFISKRKIQNTSDCAVKVKPFQSRHLSLLLIFVLIIIKQITGTSKSLCQLNNLKHY